MTLRRTIAACAAALLLAGGILAAWWWLGSDAGDQPAASRGSESRDIGAPGEPARSADPRFPPELSNVGEPSDRVDEQRDPRAERVEESPRREILLRVIDIGGRPVANVPVALGVLGSERPHVFAARSGADGSARIGGIPTPGEPVDAGMEWFVRYATLDWSLHFTFPEEAERTAIPIDLRELPTAPVEMIAPALGCLVVRLVDGGGRAVAARGQVAIDVKRAGSSRDFPSDPVEMPLTAPDELRVDPFPLGLEVCAEAMVAEYEWTRAEGPGPQQRGETATIVVTLGRHGPVMIGELVGADGRPVAGRSLEGMVHDDPNVRAARGELEVTTDERGRFRADASQLDLDHPDRRRWLDLVAVDAARGITGRARTPLPAPLRGGEVPVGRLLFEEAPLVVAGRVIDRRSGDPATGSAAPGVQIQVSRPAFAMNPGLIRGAIGNVLNGVSDDRGEFAIFGFVENGERIVKALIPVAADVDCLPVRFMPGARDVVLELLQSGALGGSLRFEESNDSIHLAVFLRRSGSGPGEFSMGMSPSRRGEFSWSRVPAGRVDVGVGIGRYSEQPNIVVVVPDVEVKPGVMNRDPRLEGLELRDRIRKARVELVDPAGELLRTGTVTLLTSDEPRMPVLTVLVQDGRAELPLFAPTFAVEVRSDGMAVERRSGLVSPARIAMRRGIPVVVALDPPFPLQEGGPVSLRLVLTKAHPEPGFVSPQHRMTLGDGASASLALPEACAMQVDLETHFDFKEPRTRAPPDRKPERQERFLELLSDFNRAFGSPIVEVRESATSQRLLVPFPPAARTILEQMIREFGGG